MKEIVAKIKELKEIEAQARREAAELYCELESMELSEEEFSYIVEAFGGEE